jgi:hypothetical protein
MADPDNRWNRRLFLHVPAIFLVLFFVLPLIGSLPVNTAEVLASPGIMISRSDRDGLR